MSVRPVTVTKQQNEKEKKGLIPYLSRLFKGKGAVGAGSRAVSGAGGTAGKGALGGLFGGAGSPFGGGIFATLLGTKAGIAGLVIGGMTIMAGLGLLYNVMQNNSADSGSRGLFSDPYYDALVGDAESNRMAKSNVTDSKSSLDYFKEANASDDVAGDSAADSAAGEKASAVSGEEAKADASAESPSAVIPRLSAAAGLGGGASGGSGGGSSTSGSAVGSRSSASGVKTGAATGLSGGVRAGVTSGTRRAGAVSGARRQAGAVRATLAGGGNSADSRRGALVDAYENSDKSGEVSAGGAGLSSGADSSDPAATPESSTNLSSPSGGGGGSGSDTTEDEQATQLEKIMFIATALLAAINLILMVAAFLKVSKLTLMLGKIAVILGLAVAALGLYAMVALGHTVTGLTLMGAGVLTTIAGASLMTGKVETPPVHLGGKSQWAVLICSFLGLGCSVMGLMLQGNPFGDGNDMFSQLLKGGKNFFGKRGLSDD